MEIDWKFVNTLIQVILTALLPPLVAFAAIWIRRQTQRLEQEIGKENMVLAGKIITSIVEAAEQLGLTGQIEDKKNWAIAEAQRRLALQGIELDLQTIDNLIESAVWSEFGWEKREELKAPVG